MTPWRMGLLLIAFGLVSNAQAQIIMKSSVFGSGAAAAVGGGVVLAGTVGQSAIGLSTGPVTARQGFWYTLRRQEAASADENRGATVRGFALSQNYPNPFADRTQFDLTVPARSRLQLMLFDDLGRRVKTLLDGDFDPGIVTVNLSASGLHAGRYIVQLLAGTERRAIALSVVK